MKKLIVLSFILSLFLIGCSPEPPPPPDFRNATWGMSKVQVEDLEEGEYLYADPTVMYYLGEQNEQDAEISYYFTEDDKLFEAQCRYVIGERTLDELISSYEQFRLYLSENYYGEPLDEEYRVDIKTGTDYDTDTDNNKIYHQVMKYYTEWETETSLVSLNLDYLNQRVNYVLTVTEKPMPEQTEQS